MSYYKKEPLKIAVDFDGTCVTHRYPEIGEDIGAVPVLRELVEKGHQLILYTMRSRKELYEAAEWFKQNGIYLYSVQRDPKQEDWTTSPKCYAHIYIDDAALGCPLLHDKDRPYVDWEKVRILLKERNVL